MCIRSRYKLRTKEHVEVRQAVTSQLGRPIILRCPWSYGPDIRENHGWTSIPCPAYPCSGQRRHYSGSSSYLQRRQVAWRSTCLPPCICTGSPTRVRAARLERHCGSSVASGDRPRLRLHQVVEWKIHMHCSCSAPCWLLSCPAQSDFTQASLIWQRRSLEKPWKQQQHRTLPQCANGPKTPSGRIVDGEDGA